MKRIVAIIRHYQLKAVKDALAEVGGQGMTVSDVRGVGNQKGSYGKYRGHEYKVEYIPRVRIEIFVCDEDADKTVETIMEKSRTGQVGDGKIVVSSLDQIVRIRTGETGAKAL